VPHLERQSENAISFLVPLLLSSGTICKTEPDIYREAEIRREKQEGGKEETTDKDKSKETQTDAKPKAKAKKKVEHPASESNSKKKKGENMASESKASQNNQVNPKKTSFEDDVITDKPDKPHTSVKSPQHTKASMEPSFILTRRKDKNLLKNEFGATETVTDHIIEPLGPRVMTYCPIRKQVVIGTLRSISNKVDEDPEIDARPRPTMMEIFEALHLRKLSQEEKKKASMQLKSEKVSDYTNENVGPTVYKYCPIQKTVLKSTLRSVISNKVDEDPAIEARHRPSAMEDFTAMIQPGWRGVGHSEKKTKDLIKLKNESDSIDEVPPRLDETTDPEGNVEEGNPDLESNKKTTT